MEILALLRTSQRRLASRSGTRPGPARKGPVAPSEAFAQADPRAGKHPERSGQPAATREAGNPKRKAGTRIDREA